MYPPVIGLALASFKALDMRISVTGAEHIPTEGGAILASNHVSYLDFIFCGLAARPSRRLVRFMAKKQIFDHAIGGPLMRGMHHIPVDRDAGMGSFRAALGALKAGEVVGMFPEATISRSFTVKPIKSGAVRLAQAAGVPLIPVALWGTQRLWTKGRPRRLWQRRLPVSIRVGKPTFPGRRDDQAALTVRLREDMQRLLDEAQREYPDSPASQSEAWWQPAHLGGTAPEPPAEPAADDSD
ncbi:lysophospholipid acyltransferase family protein [Stackebrandtia albiflava]